MITAQDAAHENVNNAVPTEILLTNEFKSNPKSSIKNESQHDVS